MIGTCAAHISSNLMVTQQIGRIIIELPLPGKCRSILNFIYACVAISLCLCSGKFVVLCLYGSKIELNFRWCGDKFMPVWQSN